MKNYGLNELREMYLNFFESKNHLRMKSFPLIPQNDNSLLLINAGMAPLKPYFTGQEKPPRKRVTTCQKCIRTGDIENIGKTARHGTFFEMLGNFSFGDYFKEEAISWAWEFVTEVIGLPEERLYVSVYEEDEEAAKIWHEKIGLSKEKIFYMGKEDNFWEVGTTGPCGPCSEIYFDRGEAFGCDDPNCTVGCECDRFMEFWNLVFTQFNRTEDGSYEPLPNPNIDTGMGLERLAAMMQGVTSIFDVDTIKAIREHVCTLADAEYETDPKKDISIRVITDHIRSATFLAADGVIPSNEGRGYVMRRLIRRAVRHGKLLGIKGLFLKKIVETVIANSKHEYTELEEKHDYIVKLLTVEEENFNKTIEQGLIILKNYIEELEAQSQTVLNGEACFKLYDTYGFPIDLTREILEEKNMSIDEEDFIKEMEKQKERARGARVQTNYSGSEETVFHRLGKEVTSEFVGYDNVSLEGVIDYITLDDEIAKCVKENDHVTIITSKTPFYAESGGQVGDQGTITTETGKVKVSQTVKAVGNKIVHYGIVVEGQIKQGQKAMFEVSNESRMDTARNHTATHLLQKVLRDVVGSHVEQAGSHVSKDRLRFDYTHFEALTPEQIKEIENLVNDAIFKALPIQTLETSIDDAKKMGAMALFGEKYGETVRVVNMGDYSIELCGGTHLANTAQVGTFKIVSETGISSGVRRIEAVTGRGALRYYTEVEQTLNEVAHIAKAQRHEVTKKVETLIADSKNLQKELDRMKAAAASKEAEAVLDQAETVNGFKVLVTSFDDLGMNDLRTMGDRFKDKLGESIIILASAQQGKVSLVAMSTDSAVKSGIHCGQIISRAVKLVNGGGGGRPNMAQAGGKDASKINEALQEARQVINEQLQG